MEKRQLAQFFSAPGEVHTSAQFRSQRRLDRQIEGQQVNVDRLPLLWGFGKFVKKAKPSENTFLFPFCSILHDCWWSSDGALTAPECNKKVAASRFHSHTITDALWVLQGRLPATLHCPAWAWASRYLTTCGSSSSPDKRMKSKHHKSFLGWQRTWRAAQSMRS